MFVSQPEIPVPLAVEFPFPVWATRPAESAGEPVGTRAGGSGGLLGRLPEVDDEPPF
jgi:hypothetical protein